jgi:hypothetical protein
LNKEILEGIVMTGNETRQDVKGSIDCAIENDWAEIRDKLTNITGVYDMPIAYEDLVTNGYTRGAMLGNGDIGIGVGGSYDWLGLFIGKTDFWTDDTPLNPRCFKGVRPITLGGIAFKLFSDISPKLQYGFQLDRSIEVNNDEKIFHMEQDILRGVVRSIIGNKEQSVSITSWVSAIENTIINELLNSSDEPVQVRLSLWVPTNTAYPAKPYDTLHRNGAYYPARAGIKDDMLWVTRETNGGKGVKWIVKNAMATRVLDIDNIVSTDEANESESTFILEPGKIVRVVTIVETIKDENSHLVTAENKVTRFSNPLIDMLYSKHVEWWKHFWTISYIEIHDDLLERYYYGALYNVACCCREGKLPPGLMGNWILTDNPMCHGDYHLNYNFQAPFYGLYSANRIEQAMSYYEPILDYIPEGRRRAREEISESTLLDIPEGVNGVLFPVGIGPWGSTPDDNTHNQVSDATFAAIPFIWHYYYTQDKEFLRDKAYPFMLALADFWKDYLRRDEIGRYVVHAGSYEGTKGFNPSQDLGFIRFLYKGLLIASKDLGIDSDRESEWQDILDNISKPPVVIHEGKKVYNHAESESSLPVGNTTDNLEFIHPGECLGLGSSIEDLEIAHDTIRLMDAWEQGNNFPKIFLQAVRVGYPLEEWMDKFKMIISSRMRNNLTVMQTGGGVETSGCIEAINSMLLQSNEDVLKLFPAWFTDKPASFKRLRTRGAFLVSSSISNGMVEYVDIYSEKGKACSLKNPWPEKEVCVFEICNGNEQHVDCKKMSDVITFETGIHKQYRCMSMN